MLLSPKLPLSFSCYALACFSYVSTLNTTFLKRILPHQPTLSSVLLFTQFKLETSAILDSFLSLHYHQTLNCILIAFLYFPVLSNTSALILQVNSSHFGTIKISFLPLVLSPKLEELTRQMNRCQDTSKAACRNMYAHTHTEGQRNPDQTRNLRFMSFPRCLFYILVDLNFQLLKGGHHCFWRSKYLSRTLLACVQFPQCDLPKT